MPSLNDKVTPLAVRHVSTPLLLPTRVMAATALRAINVTINTLPGPLANASVGIAGPAGSGVDGFKPVTLPRPTSALSRNVLTAGIAEHAVQATRAATQVNLVISAIRGPMYPPLDPPHGHRARRHTSGHQFPIGPRHRGSKMQDSY